MDRGESISAAETDPYVNPEVEPAGEAPARVAAEAPPAAAAAPARVAPLRRRGVQITLAAIVAVILAIVIAWFIYHQTTGRYLQQTDDAYLQADAVIVAPRVSGYVDKVFVSDNQQVEEGTPLVRIDAREYTAQAAQANAQIDVAKANANTVRAQIGEQRAAVEHARAALQAAQDDLQFARREVARYEPLAATGAEPREKLSQLRNQVQQAEAQVTTSSSDLTSAQRRVGSLESQVGQAQAQGEAGKAQLAAANVDVGATMLRASTAGRIGSKTVQTGQFVQAGTRMMSIVPVTQLYITANYKETQVGLMRIGQPATIDVDALDGVELHGKVASFAPGTGAEFSVLPPENATGNFTKIVQRIPVRIAIDPNDATRALLLPGMSVSVTVDTRGAKGQNDAIKKQDQPQPAPSVSPAATGAQANR